MRNAFSITIDYDPKMWKVVDGTSPDLMTEIMGKLITIKGADCTSVKPDPKCEETIYTNDDDPGKAHKPLYVFVEVESHLISSSRVFLDKSRKRWRAMWPISKFDGDIKKTATQFSGNLPLEPAPLNPIPFVQPKKKDGEEK